MVEIADCGPERPLRSSSSCVAGLSQASGAQTEDFTPMKMPENLKPMLQGAAAGAAGLALIGFTWGGWATAGASEALAKQKASAAVVAVMAPICHDNFRRSTDASARLIELKKASAWEQASLVEKAGWAKMPGAASIDTAMARACADLIVADKS